MSSDAAWRLLSWISPGALLSACIVAPPSPKTAPCCDHVAHAPQQDRIIAAGGRIVHNGGTKRVMGMLAMTRAIGDHYLRPYVIADPEVERGSHNGACDVACHMWLDMVSCGAQAMVH